LPFAAMAAQAALRNGRAFKTVSALSKSESASLSVGFRSGVSPPYRFADSVARRKAGSLSTTAVAISCSAAAQA
jgi:hypothetical protein